MSDPTEEELFEQAIADEDVKAEPVEEAEPEGDGEPALEAGGDQEAEPEEGPEDPEPQPGEGEGDPAGETIPMPRFNEVNAKRKAAEDRALEAEKNNAMLLGRFEQLERQVQQNRPAPQQEQQEEPLSFLDDPEAFISGMEQRLSQRVQQSTLQANLQAYQAVHGATFTEAFEALQQSGDEAAAGRVVSSSNPGQTLLDWHKQQKILTETGGDIEAYKAKILEQMLEDPDTLKKLGEKLKAQSGTTPGNGGSPNISLPPSVNSGTGSGSSKDRDRLPGSEEEFWNDAISG